MWVIWMRSRRCARQHQARLSLGVQRRHGIAVHVDAHAVGEGAASSRHTRPVPASNPDGPAVVEQLLSENPDGLDGHAGR